MIGALIGKKGKNIQNIQTQSRCKILVKDYPVENGGQYIAIEGILKKIILQTFMNKNFWLNNLSLKTKLSLKNKVVFFRVKE